MQQAVFFKLCVLLELPASNFRKYSPSRLEATRKDDWWCASFFSSKPFWQIRQKPFYGKLFSYEVAENYRPCYITNIVLQICHFEVHCSINVRTVNLTILLHKLAWFTAVCERERGHIFYAPDTNICRFSTSCGMWKSFLCYTHSLYPMRFLLIIGVLSVKGIEKYPIL